MDLKHIIPQQRRRSAGPALDIQYSVDRSNVPRVGPTPVFTRASSGMFVNENRRIVGKTTSTTSLNPASVPVGGVAVFAVPSGSVVGWLNNSVVSVMVDSDGNDQIGSEAHVTGTLIHKTNTAITLLVTSKVGTATVSSWFVSYRGQRIDHDPATGRCLGTLIEEGRTNLWTRSEGLDANPWFIIGSTTVTSNDTTAPDGTTTAERITVGATSQTYGIFNNQIAFASGTPYSASCFFKANQITRVAIQSSNTTIFPAIATFDLTGVGSVVGTPTGNASIQAFANGWYRCSVSATAVSSGVLSVRFCPISGTSFTYPGNSIDSFYAWGAQLEVGLNATSYIPTTAVSTARAQDLHTITGADFSYMYNQSSGTVFCSHEVSSFNGNHGVYGITAASRPAAGITVIRGLSTTIVTAVYSSPPNYDNQANFSSSVTASGQIKSAIAVRTDDFANSVNGSISTDSSGTLNPIMDRFVIGATGNTAGPQVGNNIFSAIRYYRNRLPNAQIETLTSIVSETIVFNGVPIWYNGEGLIETT